MDDFPNCKQKRKVSQVMAGIEGSARQCIDERYADEIQRRIRANLEGGLRPKGEKSFGCVPSSGYGPGIDCCRPLPTVGRPIRRTRQLCIHTLSSTSSRSSHPSSLSLSHHHQHQLYSHTLPSTTVPQPLSNSAPFPFPLQFTAIAPSPPLPPASILLNHISVALCQRSTHELTHLTASEVRSTSPLNVVFLRQKSLNPFRQCRRGHHPSQTSSKPILTSLSRRHSAAGSSYSRNLSR